MLIGSIPTKFTLVWGANADPALINAIPATSQIGINAGFASYNDGLPPLNATPIGAGGIPPRIQDFNGIWNAVTAWNQWQQAGGPIAYDATFQAAVGGYPLNAVVMSTTIAGRWWRSTVDGNTTNPDTGGAGWVDFFAPIYASPTFSGTVTLAALIASGLATFNGGWATPLGAGMDSSGQLTINNQIKSTGLSMLNAANAVLTIENATGAAGQFAYSGSSALIAALSVRVASTVPVMQGFFFGNTNVGNITTNGSSTTYGTTSDYRLKEMTGLVTGAADRLKKIRVHRFTWKGNPAAGEVDGFVAHELQTVIPEAVTGTKDQEHDVGDLYIPAGTIISRDHEDEPDDLPADAEYVSRTGNVRLSADRVIQTNYPKAAKADLPDGHAWRHTATVPVYQNVDQSKVVPLLVAALQEALDRITVLENTK